MDQVKIGKLIAMLRKEKGLTQSKLGEIVGVSDGAVSKWERGETCPDISIINLLSKTLGITSDELLAGELSNDTKKKLSHTKTLKTIIPQIIIFLIVATISVFIIVRNNTNVYKLESTDSKYRVVGKVVFSKNKTNIVINNISFNDKKINKVIINNYEYKIKCDKDTLFRKGHINDEQILSKAMTIYEFSKIFRIDYSMPQEVISKKRIIDSGIIVSITFEIENNELINKKILLKLVK